MTDEQKRMSAEREEAFLSLKPPRLDLEKGTVILDLDARLVDIERLKEKLEPEGFSPKSEFHFTVVGFKSGRRLVQALKMRPAAAEKVRALIEGTDWGLESTPKIYRIAKDYNLKDSATGEARVEQRESIVEVLGLSGLDEFYRSLSAVSGTELEPQFPHLTLFTKGNSAGIGVNSREEFDKMNPEEIKL